MSLALSRMLLDRFFPDAGAGGDAGSPPMDWKETRDAHVFRMDVPGLAKDQVAVELVDGRILRVRGGKRGDDRQRPHDQSALRRYQLTLKPPPCLTDLLRRRDVRAADLVTTPSRAPNPGSPPAVESATCC